MPLPNCIPHAQSSSHIMRLRSVNSHIPCGRPRRPLRIRMMRLSVRSNVKDMLLLQRLRLLRLLLLVGCWRHRCCRRGRRHQLHEHEQQRQDKGKGGGAWCPARRRRTARTIAVVGWPAQGALSPNVWVVVTDGLFHNTRITRMDATRKLGVQWCFVGVGFSGRRYRRDKCGIW